MDEERLEGLWDEGEDRSLGPEEEPAYLVEGGEEEADFWEAEELLTGAGEGGGDAWDEMGGEEAERLLAGQLAEIGRLDPEIRGLEDLAAMPEFGDFHRLVEAGEDLVTAFKAARFDALLESRARAAREAARRTAAGKRHIAGVGGGAGFGGGGEEIPAGALGLWREMFPGEGGEALRRRYNRTMG